MKKILKKSTFGILMTMLFIPAAYAKENDLSQYYYDSAKENINNIQLVEQKNIYVETLTSIDRYGEVTNTQQEITEEEYENFIKQQSYASCSTGNEIVSCWETNAKKLTLSIYVDKKTNIYRYLLTNLWKTIPIVKSFDVIAFRWTSTAGGITQGQYFGTQYYNDDNISYAYQCNNAKSDLSGVGISMNIVDNTSTFLELTLDQFMAFNQKTAFNLFGTYQHATSGVSLANSQSYTFKSNGLGGVLYYSNATIRNRYDGMDGVNYSFSPELYIDPTQ